MSKIYVERGGLILRKKAKDWTGQRVNSLKVIGFCHADKNQNYWKCLCDCGKETIMTAGNLSSGKVKSCGCIGNLAGNASPYWKGHGEISSQMFKSIQSHAARRKIVFDVKIDYLWDLFESQNKKCAISNVDISMKVRTKGTSKYIGTASLDRIDSLDGYVVGNVQWVHKDVNFMKQRFNQEYFVDMCLLIAEYQGRQS